jgi:hypothetical protein
MREWLLSLTMLVTCELIAQTTSIFSRDTIYFMKLEIDTNDRIDTTNIYCERVIFLNKKRWVYWNDAPLKINSNGRFYEIRGKDTIFDKSVPGTIHAPPPSSFSHSKKERQSILQN